MKQVSKDSSSWNSALLNSQLNGWKQPEYERFMYIVQFLNLLVTEDINNFNYATIIILNTQFVMKGKISD
jgi:hypothetical protein